MLDDTVLADPAALATLDSGGVLRSAATAGAQVRSTASAAEEAGIAQLEGTRPRALVLVARPGTSASAATILAALLGPACPVPVVVSELVPTWIGALDVVVAHTCDGTDYELADSIDRATRRGAEVVLTAPTEGPVASAAAGRARLIEPRVPVPPGLDLPRALAAGISAFAHLGLLGADPGLGDELGPVADALDAEAERNQPGHEPFMNPAKSLALRLADRTPLLWGTDALAAGVAAHGVRALATHAGIVAHGASAADGVTATGLLRALAGAADVFHDPFADGADEASAPPPRVVLMATGEDDPVRELRRTGRDLPNPDVMHPVEEVARGTRHAALLRAALMASRLDVAAVYLGLATRTITPA
ncbi:phospho-glucose isomerase C-terminal SIS domain-containing protein [Pseudonocardia thermophila]|uniref:Phospho-glucose isomerase C-terminal SIS domain-containing protein n=1 Tax=Pseudonocardia thermophila TaxID=1848 RepID=A0A1M6TM30_PSETH|nr:SIS domain-containing protein [Pseudonocardia thermophila]SHK57966.1 phospho-glucose isomerase C-terminal SIS domain-containing protein [Pseudonocardia thermophila]